MTTHRSSRPRRHVVRALPVVLAGIAGLAAATPAVPAWVRPSDGISPINQLPDRDAVDVAAATVGDVPYLAWRETDGTNFEVRVARLTPTGWEKVGQALNPLSPVNQDSLGSVKAVDLADVGGVPYVAWIEGDGTNDEVRVARPTADGQGWEKVGQVANPASPINVSPVRAAAGVAIANVGGVPYVAWTEFDGVNYEMRVARPTADGLGWEKVGAALRPASPINVSPLRAARQPAIASVGGVPVVAWAETDGTNFELRAARLNAAGTGWDQLGRALRPGSPINQDARRDGAHPSLVDLGGTPYIAWLEAMPGGAQVRVARLSTGGAGWERVGAVRSSARPVNAGLRGAIAPSLAVIAGRPWVAWGEDDGRNRELRVARLSASGTGWDQPVGGGSPINASSVQSVDPPSLIGVGDVPYVAWSERDGANREIRASRLEPMVLSQTASAGDQTVNMDASVRTYGLPYRVGFVVDGPGGRQVTRPGTVGGDPAPASAMVQGLTAGATYTWQLYAVMGGNGLASFGPAASVTTAAVTRLRVTPTVGTLRVRAGVQRGLRFRTTVPGVATLTLRTPAGRVVWRSHRRVRFGLNTMRVRAPWRVGTYRLGLRVSASGGRVATSTVRLVVRARR